MASSSICRDCSATMRWVKMRSGAAMPVEPIPDDRGNIAALKGSNGQYLDGQVIKPETDRAELRFRGLTVFMPHKAVCGGGRPVRPRQDQPGLF